MFPLKFCSELTDKFIFGNGYVSRRWGAPFHDEYNTLTPTTWHLLPSSESPGGVLSGIGKGVTASSIGVLCKMMGLRPTAIKIDPYLNVDAGTMSPFEHGEVKNVVLLMLQYLVLGQVPCRSLVDADLNAIAFLDTPKGFRA